MHNVFHASCGRSRDVSVGSLPALPAVAPTGPVNDSEQKFYTLSLTNDGSLVTSRTACRLARQPFRANRRPTNFLMEGAQTGDLHALHCSAGVIWDHCTSSALGGDRKRTRLNS